jgi:hypothetical protein
MIIAIATLLNVTGLIRIRKNCVISLYKQLRAKTSGVEAAGRTYISLSIKPFQNRIKKLIIVIKTVMKVFYI